MESISKRTIMVTGGMAGLGAALVEELTLCGHTVLVFDRKLGHDVRDPANTWPDMRRVGQKIAADCPPIDILINCAGVNRTGWLEVFDEHTWDEVLDTNAKGIFKMTQWALPQLIAHKGTVVNIVSNASHMPMTCSIAYNASKGAAHIMTLQMARELTKKYGITVFGISPNKLRGTEMSRDIEAQVVRDRGWTPEFAAQYQLNSLLAGEETEPSQLAEFISFLLSSKRRHKYLTGCVLPYGV